MWNIEKKHAGNIRLGWAIENDLAKELKNYTDKIKLFSGNPGKMNADEKLFSGDLLNNADLENAV